MCGHATLASAALLFAQNADLDKVTFNLSNGAALCASRLPGDLVSLTLPADDSVLLPLAETDPSYEAAVAAALAAAPAVRGNILAVAKSQKGFLVELTEQVDLAALVVEPAPFVGSPPHRHTCA